MGYSIASDSAKNGIKVYAIIDMSDKTPLVVFETEKTNNSVTYMMVLDPPSTKTAPKRISITCERQGIWNNLIKRGQEEGSITPTYKVDSIDLELIAPRDTRWKAIHPAPIAGEVKIEMLGSLSRAMWNLTNPPLKKYNYRVFLDGTSERIYD